MIYNLLGFTAYAIYNIFFYVDARIALDYQRSNGGNENLVQLNDVVFSVHAAVLTLITLLQVLYYRKSTEALVSRLTSVCLSAIILAIAAFTILCVLELAEWIQLVYGFVFIHHQDVRVVVD